MVSLGCPRFVSGVSHTLPGGSGLWIPWIFLLNFTLIRDGPEWPSALGLILSVVLFYVVSAYVRSPYENTFVAVAFTTGGLFCSYENAVSGGVPVRFGNWVAFTQSFIRRTVSRSRHVTSLPWS